PIAFAALACTIWVIKAEKIRGWLFKADTIQLKAITEHMHIPVFLDQAIAFALKKSSLSRIRDTTESFLIRSSRQTIDHDLNIIVPPCIISGSRQLRKDIFNLR